MDIQIFTLNQFPLAPVKRFTDLQIGDNYFSLSDLERIQKISTDDKGCVSYVLSYGTGSQKILGVRLTLLFPFIFEEVSECFLSPHLWGENVKKVAYFKSLFVDPDHQRRGYGRRLTEMSLKALKERSYDAVIAHSWLESPQNSSKKYLESFGFRALKIHPHFWSQVDYLCSGCRKKPCECTAEEMILNL